MPSYPRKNIGMNVMFVPIVISSHCSLPSRSPSMMPFAFGNQR